ncbi:U4/U6-U5 snRNP complex subunit prp31, partial [Coemansia erecta]
MPGQTTGHSVPAMCWVQPEWRAQFAVGSDTGVRVYRLASAEEARTGTKFELMEFQSTRRAVAALAAYPRTQAQSGVLAVGSTEGDVNLHFLASSGDGNEAAATGPGVISVYGQTGRQCRALAFNAAHGDLLACGFDFKEGRSGLHIYDISRSSDVRLLLGQADSGGDRAGTDTGTSSRGGSGAWVTSLAWVPGSVDDILVASRQTRGVVRLYDLRGRQTSETVLHMSAAGEAGMVYDVQFDPFNSVRYLAHDRRGRVGMWDLRWPPEALHTATIGDGSDVLRVAYSPRRRGVIAAMTGGSIEVLRVSEFIEGRPGNANASARAVLEEACMRDHFDDERPSAAPPVGLCVWTERVASIGAGSSQSSLLWVPPAASAAAARAEQLVTCGADGTVRASTLPVPRMAEFSCRGDLAVATNWSSLLGATVGSEAEMAALHVAAAEVRELVASAGAAAAPGSGRGLRASGNAGDASVQAALASDALVQMRQRALRGYGSAADANARIMHRDFWRWVRDADIRRRSGVYHVAPRTDISFYGVHALLRLSRREAAFLRVQSSITRQPVHRGSRINFGRTLALAFCGWDLVGRTREQHICALEAASEFAAAAGTAFVYGDHARCLLALERSSAQDQKLLSFMLKAQLAETGPGAAAGQSAPADMFRCAHLQMIFTYLVTRDWAQVLAAMRDRGLPLSTQVAVALRYLSDAQLTRFLVRVGRDAVRSGSLDALLVTGICGVGRVVLQAYVDATGDVQTAALAVSADPEDVPTDVAEQWVYAYRHLLNKWRMFTTRCLFDIAHGNAREAKGLPRMSRVGEEIALRPADVRCIFCHQGLGYDVNKWRAAQVRSSA